MKLEYIRLQNFRQYYGEQEAEFGTTPERNVTVFHGLNGAGKTSLFSALNWCLYEAATEDIGELVSKEAISRAGDREEITTSVEVGFMNAGVRLLATRTMTSRKSGSTLIHSGTKFTLAQTKFSGDTQMMTPAKAYMNLLMPANIRPYFFFDGEKMDGLMRVERGSKNQEVKEAIRNIMQLPAIERAQGDLNAVVAEYRRSIKAQGSVQVKELSDKLEQWLEKKARHQERQAAIRTEIPMVREQIQDLEDKLRGLRGVQELQRRREALQSQWDTLGSQEKTTLTQIQRLANRSYIGLLSGTAVKALALLDQKREKGEVPSGVREQLVLDLLHELRCICGRTLEKDDDAYHHLASLLKSSTTSQMASEVTKQGGAIRALSTLADNNRQSLAILTKNHADSKANRDRIYIEQEYIRGEVRLMSQDNIGGLEKQRMEFQRRCDRLLNEQGVILSELSGIERYAEHVAQEKAAAQAKEQKLDTLTRSESLAVRAAEAVTVLKDQFFEETRVQVQNATRAVFDKLAWKQDHFQGINIDSDFRLEVIDRWNTPTRQELSAGERQILSLSFICAMAQVSGEEAPLVMDTPFGRLSGNHLSAVAHNLPTLTPQLVLFVTDREWDASSQAGLGPRTGRQYKLDFDSATGCTTIREID